MNDRPAFREAFNDGAARLVGSFVTIPNATVAEVMALAGFDFLIIDIEHTGMSGTDVQTLLQAIGHHAPWCLVRVGENSETQIKQALDSGADGIVVPHVQSRADAEKAVRHTKYPPLGERGVTAARAAQYGPGFESYIAEANERLGVVALIEDANGLKNVDEIVRVEGIDGIFIGPWDLAGSIGTLGDVESPIVLDAITTILGAAAQVGKPSVMYAEDYGSAMPWFSRGVNAVVIGEDYGLLAVSAAAQVVGLQERWKAGSGDASR